MVCLGLVAERVVCLVLSQIMFWQRRYKKGGAVIHRKGRTAGGVINETRQYL